MKKGFTLVELLAIVIIIGIVAVIATPITIDVVSSARKKANHITAVNLIKAAENYHAESWLDPVKRMNVRNINNIYNDVSVEGKRPSEGELYVNNKGLVALSVEIDNVCYVKNFYGELEEKDDCTLGFKGIDETNPTISFNITGTKGNNDWYTSNAYVAVSVDDTESGIDHYLWCTGIDCVPTNVEYTNKTISVSDTTSSKVCIKAYDKAGNTYTSCSDTVKVDTIKPEINGIEDVTINRLESVDLVATYNDVTSGIATSSRTGEVDTTKSGVYEVIYTATDNAGNSKTITRKIMVEAEAPSVNFAATEGAINENGWAKNDFYVTINVTDNSGHGLKEFKVCTSVTNTCDPSSGSTFTNVTSATRLISVESNNNRVCVKAIDNADKPSEVICSDAYKLDKTEPSVGSIKVNNSSTIADWYNDNVTITTVNGTDALSGHLSTSVNVSSITESTAGTIVTLTTTDKAGNTSTANYTIKVDKTEPTVNIAKTVVNNKNVFTATVTPATTYSNYTYKWYKNNVEIEGQTSSTLETTEAGTYKVKVITGAGKEATSNEITVHSYTITYDVNNGTGSIASTTKIEDLSVNLTTTEPTRSNYTFKGWSTTSNGSVEYASGGAYTLNEDKTLYAVWQASYYCSTGTLTQSGSSYICVTNANSVTGSCQSNYECSSSDNYYDYTSYITSCSSTPYGSSSTYDTHWKFNDDDDCTGQSHGIEPDGDLMCSEEEYFIGSNGNCWVTHQDYRPSSRSYTYYCCSSYEVSYSCPSGWNHYSGSGSSMKCYRAAQQ